MINMKKVACGAAGAVFLLLALVPAAFGDSAGEALYKQKCTACHAADGSANNTMGKKLNIRDLRSADVQKQTDAELTEIITKGKNKMPSYEKSLKPEEIKGLVGYIRSIAAK